MELKKTLRVCHSTRIAASCCQTSLTIPGSCSSGSLVCGRRCAPSWWLKPVHSGLCPGGVCQCPQIGRRRIAFECSNDPVRDFWMTLLDHSQRICPTRPLAGPLVRTALLRPTPPNTRSNVAELRALALHSPGSTLKISHMQVHRLESALTYFGHDLLWPRPTLATTFNLADLG